jgi:hypothetical protein
MVTLAEPKPVLPIVAAFSSFPEALAWGRRWVEQSWGPIELESAHFDFSETKYYLASMGQPLTKVFYALRDVESPAGLPRRKRQAIRAEGDLAREGQFPVPRPINLDPGYISESKLILASTKDHAHRIYLGEGIFAEITLRYVHHGWAPWEWTYPDYRRGDFHEFFDRCREYLRRSLGKPP